MSALVASLSVLFALGLAGYLIARFVFELRWWLVELLGDFLPMVLGLLFVLFIVNALLRSWRTVILLLPLLFVAVGLYAPYYLPKPRDRASGATIEVVSFNVSSCQNTQMTDVEDWLKEIRADLVFIQEVSEAYASERITHLLDVYPYQIREPAHLRECANMILSRHPLEDAEYIRMSDSKPAYWLQRAKVLLSGKVLALYNAHFDKPLSGVPRQLGSAGRMMSAILRYDPERRDRQIERLIELLHEEELPFLVAGDFNMSEHSFIYPEMTRIVHDAFRSAGTGFGATWPAKASSPVLALLPALFRIDYIWHSESLRALEAHVGPRLGSDHLPVRAKLQWRSGA